MCVQHAFAPRPTQFVGVRALGDWRLRLHTITLPGETLDWAQFEPGLALAAEALPQPAVEPGRFGIGFVICHQGRGFDYIVLCWWSRENELPIRVLVRERQPQALWRAAKDEESICVWDIEVIERERDAYVRTVLARAGEPDIEAYLCEVRWTQLPRRHESDAGS